MNKILREEMEYLIHCDDKAITPDVKDDVSLTLQYIDELETKIDKAIEYIKCGIKGDLENDRAYVDENALLDILRGEDNE